MNYKAAFADRYWLGVAAGGVLIPAIYVLLEELRMVVGDAIGRTDFLPPPRIQLFTLAIVLIVFRLMMVNLSREKTGKGLLSVTFLMAVIYVFYSFKFRNGY
jgi:hypothetical protein